jgi:GDP-4-dehydro-6-deoxy-D-mannose reductase
VRVRALVTGAHGFVGRHLVAHLESVGDTVVAVDREHCDVTDADEVRAVVAEHRPDALYHLAAISHVGDSWRGPATVFRVNALGTLHVLDAAAAAGVGRVLVVGSAEEYGAVTSGSGPIREDAPLRPVTPYGASKVAASFLALQAHLGRGLDTVRVRPFNHTGPGQEPSFLVPSLAARVVDAEHRGTDDVPIGALDPVRDVTDVRDVVVAYRLLIEHGAPGEVYNVCRGEGHTVRSIAEHVLAASSRRLRLRVDPALVRPVETPRLVGDRSRLTAATGWEPTIPLAQTVADVVAAARTP